MTRSERASQKTGRRSDNRAARSEPYLQCADVVLVPGPPQVLSVVVLFPVFPCPPVSVTVVVVEEFVLLPTLSVVVTTHMTTPSTRVNVPPEASHNASEGETA